ncbi:tryptophan synthase subunit beta [Micromonospora sp. WMMD1120]|uniref:tryptophan synthase subunit beta n=1 Tax=Micromonospora sp. WMMD1120 TaxID=3016106 RepID=UPI0024167F3F|nr:tryptophan synthase subunit beta [Micromonospora sp. WMMD1120]MDG4810466.1 tryptophan synthase subunit beta [Micromonospora sp. WMMD1120]
MSSITVRPVDTPGRFGGYGGRYVPESLVPACEAVAGAFAQAWADPGFRAGFAALLSAHVGRPTPLTPARRLSAELGVTVLLKREDLTHTGSHKINNVLGQALLARRMGRTRLIAETGAGMHGVATATAGALLGLPVTVFMGERDMERQAQNVFRMRLLGAEIVAVSTGSRTLKDATSEALRHWVTDVDEAYYCVGSVIGPHPYPTMVREFQRVIGDEARRQCAAELPAAVPDHVVACVGGGSNAAGTFAGFVDTPAQLVGVEAEGGSGAANGQLGVLHGFQSLFLQDEHGQVREAHSIAAGLDYPGVGPEHAYLRDLGRARYVTVSDGEAIAAAVRLARTEGVLPAIESAHALAWVVRAAGTPELPTDSTVLVTLSGRGDKDVTTLIAEADLG